MARYRCYHCPRLNIPVPGEFHHFESDKPVCDRCGQSTGVQVLVDVHFLIADPRGELLGSHETRWRLACDRKRDHYAKHTEDTFSCTPDPRVVTCPSCRGVPEWEQMMKGFAAMDAATRQILIDREEGLCC